MIKRKSHSTFIALALSVIMIIGLLPVSAMAVSAPEIESIAVWVDNRTSRHPWAPPHVIVEGEPIYVTVEASYSDGSTGFLSAREVSFSIVGDNVAISAEDTGAAKGQILLRPQQPLLAHWFDIRASLKANPRIRSFCNVQVDELVVRTIVKGQENQPPLVKRGQSVQLSYEVYPESAESKLSWTDWQQHFPNGIIGTDSHITKDGWLHVGQNETWTAFNIAPPILDGPQTVRFSVSVSTIKVEGTPPHSHKSDSGTITKHADCTTEGEKSFRCTVCNEVLLIEVIPKLGHNWDNGKITIPATQEKEGKKVFTCKRCDATYTESIPKLPVTPGSPSAKFLQERAGQILKNGLSKDNLCLDGKTLTLLLDGRAFVLSTNAKNRNISGEISLDGGCFLKFDIKGNGSNIKVFQVIQK